MREIVDINFNSNDYITLNKNIKIIHNQLLEATIAKDYDLMDFYLKNYSAYLNDTKKNEGKEEFRSYFSGFFECLISVFSELNFRGKNYQKIINSRSAHLDNVIKILYNTIGIKHCDLVKKLGVESSELRDIILKLEELKLIQIDIASKYKFYSLTSEGVNYYKSINP